LEKLLGKEKEKKLEKETGEKWDMESVQERECWREGQLGLGLALPRGVKLGEAMAVGLAVEWELKKEGVKGKTSVMEMERARAATTGAKLAAGWALEKELGWEPKTE
jgi:hypothetical protein